MINGNIAVEKQPNALNTVLTKVPKRLMGTFDVICVVEMRVHVFEFKYPGEFLLDKVVCP